MKKVTFSKDTNFDFRTVRCELEDCKKRIIKPCITFRCSYCRLNVCQLCFINKFGGICDNCYIKNF